MQAARKASKLEQRIDELSDLAEKAQMREVRILADVNRGEIWCPATSNGADVDLEDLNESLRTYVQTWFEGRIEALKKEIADLGVEL